MALKGTLRDFSLADILQLIGIQRKTGVLNLHGSDDLVSISFLQGTIVSAESATRRLEDRVASVLLKWGHCTGDELETARQTQKQTLERLWTLLLRQDSVDGDQVRQALLLQIEKIIYPVFRWQDGEYSFIQEADIDYDREHLTPIHSETVLMEGVRMMDEWPILERKIRSAEMIFSRAPVSGEVVVSDEANGLEQPGGDQVRMAQEEFAVYDLVDGVRSVAEIQELAPTHDFSSMSVLCNLMGAGLITQSGDARSPAERDRGEGSGGGRGVGQLVSMTLLWLAAAALLAFSVPRLHLNPLNILVRNLGDGDRAARLVMLRENARMHRLEERLEAYRLEHGQYPEALSGLVETGFAETEDLITSDGRMFAYRTGGGRFTLRFPGVAPAIEESDADPAQ